MRPKGKRLRGCGNGCRRGIFGHATISSGVDTEREKGGNIQRAAAPWQRTARCGQRGMGRPGRPVGDDGRARVSQVNAGCN